MYGMRASKINYSRRNIPEYSQREVQSLINTEMVRIISKASNSVPEGQRDMSLFSCTSNSSI